MGLASKLAKINQQQQPTGSQQQAPQFGATIPARSEDSNYSFAAGAPPANVATGYPPNGPPQGQYPPSGAVGHGYPPASAGGYPSGGSYQTSGYPTTNFGTHQSTHHAGQPSNQYEQGRPNGYYDGYPAHPQQSAQSGYPPGAGGYSPAGSYPAGGSPSKQPAGGALQNSGVLESLRRCIADNRLERFYPEQRLQQVAMQTAELAPRVAALCQDWRMPVEMGYDLYKLALYDIVMLCDDSGSMAFEESGERIKDLEMIISYAARAASLFDHDGISVRFLNSAVSEDFIRDAASVQSLIKRVNFNGLTPLGTALDQKLLQPFFHRQLEANSLSKPILVIIVTDGVPAGEPRDCFEQVLRKAFHSSQNGCSIAFSIAQVGTDMNAQRFLSDLDKNREFGRMVDVTSNYELEQEEMRTKGIDLTPELWVCKLLMGAIDPTYDQKDE